MKTISFQTQIVIALITVTTMFNVPFNLKAQKTDEYKFSPDSLVTNEQGGGPELELIFKKGVTHNHPLMAIWVEDTAGQYIQTLYIAKSIATGTFAHGDASSGRWEEGPVRRPAALPYWAHKRGIKADDGLYMPTPEQPVPDAYSGATPASDFALETRLDSAGPKVFNVLLEINQPWDWNDYWTNNKFPGNKEYMASAQPSVIYQATINLSRPHEIFQMKLIGHGHYAGADGKLYTDISTLTDALQITKIISVSIR